MKNYRLLVLNGPNINMLGIREPDIYGRQTYDDLVDLVQDHVNKINQMNQTGDTDNTDNTDQNHDNLYDDPEKRIAVEVEFLQSNHEGDLVDAIQKAYFDKVDGIVFNPAAYTHTSVAIADAVKGVGIPTVEVHISDVSSREDFRQISYIRDVAVSTISGQGLNGYNMAIDLLLERFRKCSEM